MGLDVRVHVMNKKFGLVKKDLLDSLPYDFRVTFHPGQAEQFYQNYFYGYEAQEYPQYSTLKDVFNFGEWTTFVKVADVKLYAQDHALDAEFKEAMRSLSEEDILVVEGDQTYDRLCGSIDPTLKAYGDIDGWFEKVRNGEPLDSDSGGATMFNACKVMGGD